MVEYRLCHHVILSILTVLVLAFSSQEAQAEPREIRIGLLSELTGPGAPNGVACRDGYETARRLRTPNDKLGEVPIRFLFGDHKGDAKTGISEFLRVGQQEQAIVVLSNRANIGRALDPISVKMKIPFFGAMQHRIYIEENPYGLRVWPSAEQEGRMLAEQAITHGKRLSMVVLQDELFLALSDAMEKRFKELGGSIVRKEDFTEDVVDFSPYASRIRQSVQDSLFVSGTVSQYAPLFRRFREQGITQPLLANFWIGYPEVRKAAGDSAMAGGEYFSIDIRRPKFLAAAKQVSDREPSAVTYACYTALSLTFDVLEGISAQGKPLTRDSVIEALPSVESVKLPDETLKVVNREVLFAFQLHQLKAEQK